MATSEPTRDHSEDLSSATIARIGGCLFERNREGQFVLRGEAPPWCRALLKGKQSPYDLLAMMPFLEGFLPEAEDVWRARIDDAWSGPWTQELTFPLALTGDSELVLEARAVRLADGRAVLLLQRATERFQEKRRILQKARDALLGYERLRKEVDRKDLLLHCIVHDLRSPLSGMVGTMSLVQSRKLSADDANELLTLGLEQARYQESMIKSILEAFASEVRELESFETTLAKAPDLRQALDAVVKRYASAFRAVEVGLDLEFSADLESPCPVVGRSDRLERVLENLLENALRYSPPTSTVRVGAESQGNSAVVTIQDQGPGVPPQVQERLFEKFSQARRSKGVAGLGLYFCRSTLELWGGSISYVEREERGACFRITLPRARPGTESGRTQVRVEKESEL